MIEPVIAGRPRPGRHGAGRRAGGVRARPPLDPPAAALGRDGGDDDGPPRSHGGLLARVDGEPAGALVLDPDGRTMFLRRFGVVPPFSITMSPPR